MTAPTRSKCGQSRIARAEAAARPASVPRALADGHTHVGVQRFEEISGAIIGAPAVAVLVLLLLRFPLHGPTWRRPALIILLAFVPISLVHTWMLVSVRALTGHWFGFTEFGFDVPAARFA